MMILAGAAAIPLLIAGCTADSSKSANTAAGADTSCTYYLVSFQGDVNTFMSAEEKGVQQAGKDFGIKAVFEGPKQFDVQEQVNLLRSAAASHPCGIATGLADPKALNDPIKSLISAGIPVVLWNVQSFPGAEQDPQIASLGYVGQDETQSGSTLAAHLIPTLKSGAHVVFGVDTPGELVAQERFQGVQKALEAAGMSCELLNVGADPTQGESIYSAYMAKHPETAAIVSNAATTAQAANLYVQHNNRQDLVVAGFDMADPLVNSIKDGTMDFALDQQPYLQGYFAIEELFLEYERGFQPVNVNTGTFFVDKTNIDSFQKLLAAGVGA